MAAGRAAELGVSGQAEERSVAVRRAAKLGVSGQGKVCFEAGVFSLYGRQIGQAELAKAQGRFGRSWTHASLTRRLLGRRVGRS